MGDEGQTAVYETEAEELMSNGELSVFLERMVRQLQGSKSGGPFDMSKADGRRLEASIDPRKAALELAKFKATAQSKELREALVKERIKALLEEQKVREERRDSPGGITPERLKADHERLRTEAGQDRQAACEERREKTLERLKHGVWMAPALREKLEELSKSLFQSHAFARTCVLQFPTEKEVNESDIPYLPCRTTLGVIEECGAFLRLGDVTAKYPPGSLPLHCRATMMSMEVEPGFRYGGEVSLSPQVAIGPHCECELGKPITLSLPLEVRDKVTVLVSRTAAGLPPDWQEVPECDITICSNHIEIKAARNCIYQAQCGCKLVIKPVFQYVYFSVLSHFIPGINTLLLRCSGRREFCTRQYGEYRLCHSEDETIKIRAVNGEALHISLESKGERPVRQLNTPLDMNKELDCVLNEQVVVSVGESINKASMAASEGDRSFQLGEPSAPDGGESKALEEFLFQWNIKMEAAKEARLSSASGAVSLKVQTRHMSLLEEATSPCAKRLECEKCHVLRDVTGVVAYLHFLVTCGNDQSKQVESRSDNVASHPDSITLVRRLPASQAGDRLLLRVCERLSKEFTSASMCDSLATHLEVTTIERDFVKEYIQENPDSRRDFASIAYATLREWIKEGRASGLRRQSAEQRLEALYSVLSEDMESERLSRKLSTLWQFYAEKAAVGLPSSAMPNGGGTQ